MTGSGIKDRVPVKAAVTVGEIVTLAVGMETKGMHFYNWAAEQFSQKNVKDIFHKLSQEEKEHIDIFRNVLELPGTEQTLDENVGKYLQVVGQDIFPHHDAINSDNIKTPADALGVGIQAEKDAILLYQELYNQTESDEVKKVLSKLLEEEKMHLIDLRDYMDEIRTY